MFVLNHHKPHFFVKVLAIDLTVVQNKQLTHAMGLPGCEAMQAFSRALQKSRKRDEREELNWDSSFFHSLTSLSASNSIFTSSPISWKGA